MATTTIPSASSEALNITKNDAACADPQDEASADFRYEDGALTWDSTSILDDNVITAINTLGGTAEYTIFSLEPETPQKIEHAEGEGETNEATPKGPFKLRTTNAMILPQAFLDKFLFRGLPPYLKVPTYVLISTLSGIGLAAAFFDEVLHPLLRAIGFEDSKYTVIKTKSADSVKELTRLNLIDAANEGKEQTVIILSGDGGVVDTINALEEKERSSKYTKPTFVPLPFGTGNALFHSLHRSSPLSSIYIQSLRTLLRGIPKPLPTFLATFSPGARLLTDESRVATPLLNNSLYGAVVASHGLHSTLVADSDTVEYRKHGDERFGMAFKDLMFPADGSLPHRYKTQVTLLKEGKEEVLDRKEHGYVLATMVSNLEKTFTISPKSQPFERSLWVVHFGCLGGEEAGAVMGAAYQGGKHIEMESVGYEKVDGIRIKFNEEGKDWRWRRVCIDGSIVAVEEGGWMDVRVVEEGRESICVVADE